MMKKTEDPVSRQQFYSKCKDSIVKKSNELGALCDTNIALLMVSPNGEMTSYSSGKSFEDIMIKEMNQPDELNRRSTPNPDEEAHKEKLTELQKILSEAKEKRSSYEPQVENINTLEEADAYKEYLLGAMGRVQQSKEPVGDGRFDETSWITLESQKHIFYNASTFNKT
ncbi:agamous-like MADS-box protein AGL66 [Solanum pennellii]|uniref:Agamous-like MADS-box protein AGL66 n=1 Tax=Solanum pennellii TaxID=28526 RepID=A0ABM1H015_SOLPN|nr:agamous-like MADS-box protein AGL66 [Solanum pennellii]